MSDLPKKKLKQVCLPFSMTPSTKKRKLEDEVVSVDLVKLRKIHDETKNEQEPNGDDSNDASKENENDLSFDASESVSNSFEKSKSLVSLSKKKLTPKQLAKKQESEARRRERERIKQEKERKKQEEKEIKEKKRLAEIEAKNEEKRQREEEKRIREEERKAKEEEKRKQREEEKRLKEEERKAKEEEKRAKEEERKAKEEERKAKEEERKQKIEEKQRKEELERKNKEKIAAAFTNFFLKSSQTKNASEIVEKPESSRFMPFEVKADMKVPEIHRAALTAEQKAYLDQILQDKVELDKSLLYLAQLRTTNYKPGHSENTWPLNLNDDEDDARNDSVPGNYVRTRYRGKLFQFAENRRPAYWGTWRKRSKSISGRNPFKCDTEFFEYDIDSDEEWVEEPGESLHGSDDEKESDNEYEVDNDFFVPHGYLSDEEAQDDDDDVKNKSPNSQKIKLNILEKEFEAELNEKTRKLKPRYYGCIWIPNNVEKSGVDEVEDLLLSFRAQWNDEQAPFCLKIESLSPSTQSTPSSKTKASSEFPEQFIPDLIKLVHGNKNRAKNIVKEFISYVLSKDSNINLTSVCVKKKMKEISSWHVTACYWYVNDDIRACHNLADLSPLDNNWKYVTTVCTQFAAKKVPKQNEKLPLANLLPQTSTTPVIKHSLIDKFVKVLTPEEKERQLKAAIAEKKSETTKHLASTFILNEQKRKDNIDGEKPVKKRAVLFTMNKDKMWTLKTGSKSSKTTVPGSFQENDLNTSKSAGENALCKHVPDVKRLSKENVTVTKSTQDIQDKNTDVQSDIPTFLNCNVPLNDSSSTAVTIDTDIEEEIITKKKLTNSNGTGSDSKLQNISTSINESKDVSVDLKSQVSNSKITIRKGKKYATLITVTKVRD